MDEFLSEEFEKYLNHDQSHDKFLQFYHLRIGSVKVTPEYIGIMNDLKFLMSLDPPELEHKVKKVVLDIEGSSENHAENESDLLNEIMFKNIIADIREISLEPLSLDEATLNFIFILGKVLSIDYEKSLKGNDLLFKNNALFQFLINLRMEFNFSILSSSPEFKNIPIELINKIRDMGADQYFSDSTNILENKQLQTLMHQIVSSRTINLRHAVRQKAYSHAIDDADYLWSVEKSPMTINEMVAFLLEKAKYKNLSQRALREQIYSVAKKHDKIPPRGRPRKK